MRRTDVALGGVADSVTLHLAGNLFEGSTGGHQWGAGFRLAELLLTEPGLVRGELLDCDEVK